MENVFLFFRGSKKRGGRGKGVFSFVPTRIVLPSMKEEGLVFFMFFLIPKFEHSF